MEMLLLAFTAMLAGHLSSTETTGQQGNTYEQTDSGDDTLINKGNKPSRAPKRWPVDVEGNVLYLYGQYSYLTLQLSYEDQEIYSTTVLPGTDYVILPCDKQGFYELLLSDGQQTYTYEIKIE